MFLFEWNTNPRVNIQNSGLATAQIDQTQRRNIIQGLKGIRDRIDFLQTWENVCLHS